MRTRIYVFCKSDLEKTAKGVAKSLAGFENEPEVHARNSDVGVGFIEATWRDEISMADAVDMLEDALNDIGVMDMVGNLTICRYS
jgi:hypothetical protein